MRIEDPAHKKWIFPRYRYQIENKEEDAKELDESDIMKS